MGTDRFDLVDVTIVMNVVVDQVGMNMKYHAFEHVMTKDGVFVAKKREGSNDVTQAT